MSRTLYTQRMYTRLHNKWKSDTLKDPLQHENLITDHTNIYLIESSAEQAAHDGMSGQGEGNASSITSRGLHRHHERIDSFSSSIRFMTRVPVQHP